MSLTIQPLSDTHFEYHRDHGVSFVASLDPTDVDVLVLAGDIFPWRLKPERETFRQLCARYADAKVIYVPGNHELYKFNLDDRFRMQADLLQEIPNLYFLQNSTTIIRGVRFVGTTLWFADEPDNVLWENEYADFDSILGFKPWVYEQHRMAKAFLEREVRKNDVVVTHFLPTSLSCDPVYKCSPTNRYFVADCANLILDREPQMWFHGHTHYACHYEVGATWVHCNPLGAPSESIRSGFNEDVRFKVY